MRWAMIILILTCASVGAYLDSTGSQSSNAAVGASSPQLGTPAPLPTSLSVDRPFSVTIERTTLSANELRALEAAEAVYPPREDVLKAIEEAHFKLKSVPRDTRLWWSSEFDGVRVAYAITADTVRYYLNLTAAFREGRFEEVGVLDMRSSSLSYRASVSRTTKCLGNGTDCREAFLVKMSLSWSDNCGMLCGLNFTKSREVIVSLDGAVLSIVGDATPDLLVS